MKVLKRVSKKEFKDFLDYEMNLSDSLLYEELNNSQQFIFQFSGATAAGMIRAVNVKNMEEVVAVNAISRPGSSSMLDPYIHGKNTGQRKYPKQISSLLEDTYGTILFQEQIMLVFAEIAGYDPEGTNIIRGLLKKLGKQKRNQKDVDEWNNIHVPAFKKGCLKLGIQENEVMPILDDIVQLSRYSFNKSHSFSYSLIAMMTVYMSRYFRSYYYSASLTYDAGKKDALKESIQKVEERGYKISPPDVNSSGMHFKPNGQVINFGLNEIKGVGEQPAKDVIANRPYESIIDFIIKNVGNSINRRITKALLCGGAFDPIIGEKRKYYENVVDLFYDKKKTTKTIPLLQEKWDDAVRETADCTTTGEDYINYEETYLGGQFFHNKFSVIADKIEALYKKGYCLRDFKELREKNLPKQYVFVYLSRYKRWKDKNQNDMMFFDVEDRNGEKTSFPVFASYWEHCKVKFFEEGFYLMDLYPTEDGKIMFGSRNWVRDPNTIKNMMARVTV